MLRCTLVLVHDKRSRNFLVPGTEARSGSTATTRPVSWTTINKSRQLGIIVGLQRCQLSDYFGFPWLRKGYLLRAHVSPWNHSPSVRERKRKLRGLPLQLMAHEKQNAGAERPLAFHLQCFFFCVYEYNEAEQHQPTNSTESFSWLGFTSQLFN